MEMPLCKRFRLPLLVDGHQHSCPALSYCTCVRGIAVVSWAGADLDLICMEDLLELVVKLNVPYKVCLCQNDSVWMLRCDEVLQF